MTANEPVLPTAKFLKDYTKPEYLIPTVELFFNLDDHQTLVRSKLSIDRVSPSSRELVLNAAVNKINWIRVNGKELSSHDYLYEKEILSFELDQEHAVVEIESVIDPANNTSLEGLYKSAGAFCTQCEAEGFRKITPFLDRPDVLSVYTVTIYADQAQYPYLLSNGNDIERGEFQEGDDKVSWVKWHDPHPKPCYLFALVAGDFDCLYDEFNTRSGRSVSLELYVDKGNLHLSQHAMDSLKKSMQWDEKRYSLEYDLDKYMIVAVDSFNMGAMENKGLNVFNSKYVLADNATATDDDYHGVEAVIAHEYFHNWTGNRVTCRDWFQLSLKEGLTVFRDQQFSADMGSEVLERIKHANIIRTMQFAEDAGPMAHPIRPQKVIEMNNFYTVTVYDKGAEVIRMLHSLLGEQGFCAGMALYFERHDGQAVTCDDFVAAMADANKLDLTQFKNWYQQAGTPVVTVKEQLLNGQMQVEVGQSIPTRPDDERVLPLQIPIKYELLAKADGRSLIRGTWSFSEQRQKFVVPCAEPAHLVLFENFSAPVKVERELSLEDRIFMATHASDPFCRWDLVQSIWLDVIQSDQNQEAGIHRLSQLLADILEEDGLDMAVKAELMAKPQFDALAQGYQQVNVEQILQSKTKIEAYFVSNCRNMIETGLAELEKIDNGYTPELVARRRLKQVLLSYLAVQQDQKTEAFLSRCFDHSPNMTEKVATLHAMRAQSIDMLNSALQSLEQEFSGNVLVLDKILSAVARVADDSVYDLMHQWSQHSDFTITNPNRVRALYGAFAMANPEQFHHASGRGYEFLTDFLIKFDKINPQVAARMVTPLLAWRRYDAHRQALMQSQLRRLSQQELSKDLFEKVSSALA